MHQISWKILANWPVLHCINGKILTNRPINIDPPFQSHILNVLNSMVEYLLTSDFFSTLLMMVLPHLFPILLNINCDSMKLLLIVQKPIIMHSPYYAHVHAYPAILHMYHHNCSSEALDLSKSLKNLCIFSTSSDGGFDTVQPLLFKRSSPLTWKFCQSFSTAY